MFSVISKYAGMQTGDLLHVRQEWHHIGLVLLLEIRFKSVKIKFRVYPSHVIIVEIDIIW